MPRALRIVFAGACYHVICRGDRREDIFLGDEDRGLFLETLGEACTKTGWVVHAFVLMPNHYHLVVETPQGNLVEGMRWFQGTYTIRFNARHRLSGHLFQGRYKSLLIDAGSGEYLRTVANYVHLNPVRARLVEAAALPEYLWSSVRWYRSPRGRPAWFRADRVLGAYGFTDDASARRRYVRHLIEEGSREQGRVGDENPYARIRRGWFFGDEDRKQALLKDADGLRAHGGSYSGAAADDHRAEHARRLVSEELRRAKLTLEAVKNLPWTDKRKRQIARVVRGHTTMTNRWVADLLGGGHESTVSRAVHEQE